MKPAEPKKDCEWLKEKSERDKERNIVHDNIFELKEQIASLNSYLTTQIKLSSKTDEELERKHNEIMKKVEELEERQRETANQVEMLNHDIHNGWKTGFINEVTDRMFGLFETQMVNKHETQMETEKRKSKNWVEFFKIAGIILASSWFTNLVT